MPDSPIPAAAVEAGDLDAACRILLKKVLLTSPDDFDALGEESSTTRGFAPVIYSSWGGPKFQGGKEDLRRIVREIASALPHLAAPVGDVMFLGYPALTLDEINARIDAGALNAPAGDVAMPSAERQSAWAALRMVRDAVGELFGPRASIESEEAVLLRGPEYHHEAEAIVAALMRVATPPADAGALNPGIPSPAREEIAGLMGARRMLSTALSLVRANILVTALPDAPDKSTETLKMIDIVLARYGLSPDDGSATADVAGLVVELRAGGGCDPCRCEERSATSGCTCVEAADKLSALASDLAVARQQTHAAIERATEALRERDAASEERYEAQLQNARLRVEYDQITGALRADRDALAERLREVEAERDVLSQGYIRISQSLGGTDEWSDLNTMVQQVSQRAEEMSKP